MLVLRLTAVKRFDFISDMSDTRNCFSCVNFYNMQLFRLFRRVNSQCGNSHSGKILTLVNDPSSQNHMEDAFDF